MNKIFEVNLYNYIYLLFISYYSYLFIYILIIKTENYFEEKKFCIFNIIFIKYLF